MQDLSWLCLEEYGDWLDQESLNLNNERIKQSEGLLKTKVIDKSIKESEAEYFLLKDCQKTACTWNDLTKTG